MSKEDAAIVGLLGCVVVPAVAVLFIVSFFVDTWVFYTLWHWLVVPTMDAPNITFLAAICIRTVYGCFHVKHIPSTKSDDLWVPFVSIFLSPIFYLATGYVLSLYV